LLPLSCREALAAAQNDAGSMRAAQLGDRERLEAALETEAALRREVTQLTATREQLEAALAQVLDRADVFRSVLLSL
jgi:anti-sigma factor RsiW